MIELAANGVQTGRGPRGRYLFHDAVNGEVRAAPGRAARRAHVGRCDPRDRRLPRGRRARRHVHRHGQRGLGDRVDGGRHLPARHAFVADPPGRGGRRARPRRRRPRRPRCRSGPARRPRARRSSPRRCRPCAAASTASSHPASPTTRARGSREQSGVEGDAATMIVDYVAVGRAVLGVTPTLRDDRARTVLRRDRRHAARDPLAVRRPHQPRVRARAAQEVLPHLQLRAPGRGERRRDRAVARSAPQLPARRGPALRAQRHRRRHAASGGARRADVPLAVALEPQPGAARAALPRWPPQPAADPAHGSRRLHGRAVPAGRRVPGERDRPDRDPRPPDRAPDDVRHAARGARRRRSARAARARSRKAR